MTSNKIGFKKHMFLSWFYLLHRELKSQRKLALEKLWTQCIWRVLLTLKNSEVSLNPCSCVQGPCRQRLWAECRLCCLNQPRKGRSSWPKHFQFEFFLLKWLPIWGNQKWCIFAYCKVRMPFDTLYQINSRYWFD